jgi:hypothetical protein
LDLGLYLYASPKPSTVAAFFGGLAGGAILRFNVPAKLASAAKPPQSVMSDRDFVTCLAGLASGAAAINMLSLSSYLFRF